jgi:hypothetical protein
MTIVRYDNGFRGLSGLHPRIEIRLIPLPGPNEFGVIFERCQTRLTLIEPPTLKRGTTEILDTSAVLQHKVQFEVTLTSGQAEVAA